MCWSRQNIVKTQYSEVCFVTCPITGETPFDRHIALWHQAWNCSIWDALEQLVRLIDFGSAQMAESALSFPTIQPKATHLRRSLTTELYTVQELKITAWGKLYCRWFRLLWRIRA
jgi:hypothetical protein